MRHETGYLTNFYGGRSVLVTGAGGFIGSHLVEALSKHGANVTAFFHYNHDLSLGNLTNSKEKFTAIHGDVCDPDIAGRIFDVVFHLAALIDIPYSYVSPVSYINTNVIGTHKIAEYCANSGATMIHTSTSEVYGTAQTEKMSEKHPLSPHSPYAASKVAADALVQSYVKSFYLKANIIRPFNVIGPRQSGRAVTSHIIRSLLNPEIKEVRLGDIKPKRSLTYVSDTVRAFLLAGSLQWEHGHTINVGTPKSWSVEDIFESAKKATGVNKPFVLDTSKIRPNDVMNLCPDITKAVQILGWLPTYDLDEMIKKTVEETLHGRHTIVPC